MMDLLDPLEGFREAPQCDERGEADRDVKEIEHVILLGHHRGSPLRRLQLTILEGRTLGSHKAAIRISAQSTWGSARHPVSNFRSGNRRLSIYWTITQ